MFNNSFMKTEIEFDPKDWALLSSEEKMKFKSFGIKPPSSKEPFGKIVGELKIPEPKFSILKRAK